MGDKDPSIVAGISFASVPELQGISANTNHVMITSSFSNADSKLVRFDKGDDGKMTNGMYVTMPPFWKALITTGIQTASTPYLRVRHRCTVLRQRPSWIVLSISIRKHSNKYALPPGRCVIRLGLITTKTSKRKIQLGFTINKH